MSDPSWAGTRRIRRRRYRSPSHRSRLTVEIEGTRHPIRAAGVPRRRAGRLMGVAENQAGKSRRQSGPVPGPWTEADHRARRIVDRAGEVRVRHVDLDNPGFEIPIDPDVPPLRPRSPPNAIVFGIVTVCGSPKLAGAEIARPSSPAATAVTSRRWGRSPGDHPGSAEHLEVDEAVAQQRSVAEVVSPPRARATRRSSPSAAKDMCRSRFTCRARAIFAASTTRGEKRIRSQLISSCLRAP